MWAQYRKTALRIQSMIVVVVIAVYFFNHRQWPTAIAVLVAMEIAAVLGAAWGARLKSKMDRESQQLPLHRRGL